jgi:transposase-like protein
VFGLKQTGGKVYTRVVPDTRAVTLKPIIEELVQKGAIIVTDEWGAYNGLSSDYAHIVINHNENEYVRGGFHTNGIENFWSLLKRGLYGIYHHASAKHLHRYTTEFQYRYNSRSISDSERFAFSLKNTDRKLTYKELIKK